MSCCHFAPRHFHIQILLLGLLVGLLGRSTPAGERRMHPHDVARLRLVTRAAISPDGKRVAYTLAVQRKLMEEEDGPAYIELHVVDARGNSRPFVTGQVNISDVQWTPDGRHIAYVARRREDDHACLYQIPTDGGESQKLIQHNTSLSHPEFTADGKHVAFLAQAEQDPEQQEIESKGFNQQIYEEDWRPSKVWIADVDGQTKPRALDLPGSASQVAWHPRREELAVVLAPTSLVDDSYMFQRVYIVDAGTGRVIEKVNNPGKLGAVRWSPDGKHLAMISAVDIHDPSAGRLMVVAVPGNGQLRDLMPDYKADVRSFAWIDDESLMWIADEGTQTSVGSVALRGTREVRIDAKGPILSGLTLSDDGTAACMTGHTAQHPSDVFLLTSNPSKAQRLTHSNSWLDEIEFAPQETIAWKARDGLQLQGVLVKPLHYQEGRRYPLIMLVHGGPEAHISNGWVTYYSRPGQVAAARGFAVFYPNYRGSTGRGVEFSKMGQADAAGKEFDDLVDGIDHLVEFGLVHRDKVGITGGSYGGYASAWGSTFYSDRYAASVMFVGISDNVSKVGTTDIPEEMFLVHHRKRLWDDWDYFLERSPIRHVEKNRTPTLILHGKEDPRVHPSQSLELYRHLKTLKQAPVRLVLYQGEGHGNRKAAARFDYSLRLLRWMEHYLMGPGGELPPYEIDYQQSLAE